MSDAGYTSEQLEDVERRCEFRLERFEDTDDYDAKFDSCEASEKRRINPDPFG